MVFLSLGTVLLTGVKFWKLTKAHRSPPMVKLGQLNGFYFFGAISSSDLRSLVANKWSCELVWDISKT